MYNDLRMRSRSRIQHYCMTLHIVLIPYEHDISFVIMPTQNYNALGSVETKNRE